MLTLLAVMPREIPAADLSLTGLKLTQTYTHGNKCWEGDGKERGGMKGRSLRGEREKKQEIDSDRGIIEGNKEIGLKKERKNSYSTT